MESINGYARCAPEIAAIYACVIQRLQARLEPPTVTFFLLWFISFISDEDVGTEVLEIEYRGPEAVTSHQIEVGFG